MAARKRIVVGVGVDGRSEVLVEESLSTLPEVAPGIEGRDLWLNESTPAPIGEPSDPVGRKPLRHEPPHGGAVFRIMRLAPRATDALDAQGAIDLHAHIGSEIVPTKAELGAAKHPSMHRTRSLNYLTVTDGEVWLLTEGRDVLLRAGDTIVQLGGMHGWRNDGPDWCTIVGVLVSADDSP